MTGTKCFGCFRQLGDGAPLCRDCVGRLVDALLSVPGLLHELTITRAGLGRTAPRVGGARPSEPPLPVRTVPRSEGTTLPGERVVRALEVSLIGWGRAISEDLGVCPAVHTAHLVDLVHRYRAMPLGETARQCGMRAEARPDLGAIGETPASVGEQAAVWLARHPEQLRQHEAAPELLDELTRAIKSLQRIVWPPQRRYLGLCPALLDDGTTCGHERSADIEATHSKCPRCGDHRPISDLQKLARRAAEDRLYTISELEQVTASVGARVPRRTLFRWQKEHTITPRGWQHHSTGGTRITDHPIGPSDQRVYRLGDVLDIASRDQKGSVA
ncbi:hypothetical protein ACW2Q0_00635 [Nocardia sp. R16R-3T]